MFQFAPFEGTRSTIQRLDGLIFDIKVNYLPPWPNSVVNIQVVDIDEKSLAEIGRMPWSREHFANLTSRLTEQGALLVVYDVLFSEPEENQAQRVFTDLTRDPQNNIVANTRVLEQLQKFDFDTMFSRAMGDQEVILANLFHNEPLTVGFLSRQSVMQNATAEESQVLQFKGYAGPINLFSGAASGIGFMNAVAEADGFVRRAPLLAVVDGVFYPSLSLEAFRVYSLVDRVEPVWQKIGEDWFLEGVLLGNEMVSTDNQGRIIIPFRGAEKSYPYTSASDVLNGLTSAEQFDQAIVFVGTSSVGLADLRTTPTSRQFPGVEIHATVFDALSSPEIIPHRPDWWQGALLLQMVVLTIICYLFLSQTEPTRTLALALVLLVVTIGINIWLWLYHYLEFPSVTSVLLVLSLSAFYVANGFLEESNRRKQVRRIFAQYVPPAHIDKLLASGINSMEGDKKCMSVLFCDIRDFTSISEGMTAQDLKAWLNEYLSPMTKVIFDNDGTIDKYVGDMIMAFWGAPLDDPDHAHKSIVTAFSMLAELNHLNKQFSQSGKANIQMGIGINTGDMNVGDMGSDFRRNYTVLGDAVNLGSRIEGLTKYYGFDVLVSEFTREKAPDFEYVMVDKVRVKGKLEPVTLYAPLSMYMELEEKQHWLTFNDAIERFFKSDFTMAEHIINGLPDTLKNSRLAAIFYERIEHYQLEPPGEDWDGCFVHQSK